MDSAAPAVFIDVEVERVLPGVGVDEADDMVLSVWEAASFVGVADTDPNVIVVPLLDSKPYSSLS